MKSTLKNKTWKFVSRAISIVGCILLLNNSICEYTLVFACSTDENQEATLLNTENNNNKQSITEIQEKENNNNKQSTIETQEKDVITEEQRSRNASTFKTPAKDLIQIAHLVSSVVEPKLTDLTWSIRVNSTRVLGINKGDTVSFTYNSWKGKKTSEDGWYYIEGTVSLTNMDFYLSDSVKVTQDTKNQKLIFTRTKMNDYDKTTLNLRNASAQMKYQETISVFNTMQYYWGGAWYSHREDIHGSSWTSGVLGPINVSSMIKQPDLNVTAKNTVVPINQNATISNPEEYVKINNSNQEWTNATYSFDKKPDVGKVGKSEARIRVSAKTPDGWQYPDKVVDVTFDVKPTLIAELISQDTVLGENISGRNPEKSIKKVTLGGKTLSSSEYTVKWGSNWSNNTVGKQTWPATITTNDGQHSLNVELPFDVKWGSTVLLRGFDNESVGAISLHQMGGDDLELTDYVGITRKSNESPVHPYFTSKTYYDLRLLRPIDTPKYPKDLKTVTTNNSLTWSQGEWRAQDRMNIFGDNSDRHQKAISGDILEVTHEEPDTRERLIVNEMEKQENDGQKIVYYELTKSGFIPVRVNQLRSKKSTIPFHSDEAYLDKHIKEYIDLRGYSNIEVKKFSSYPTTNKSGETSGKIVVEETLKSGKKLQWEYHTLFTVEEDKSSIESKDSELYEGQKWHKEDNFVSATDEEGKKVSFDDKRITISGSVDSNSPGIYEMKYTFEGKGKPKVSNFKVTVKEAPALTAESVKQKTVLGTDTSKWDAHKLIKNVKKEDDENADSKEYTAIIKQVADTQTIGIKTLMVEITRIANGKTTNVEVPVTVEWGSTIEVDNVIYPGNSGYALTLHTGDEPKIVATYGNNTSRRNNWINDYTSSEYLKTMIYAGNELSKNSVITDQKPSYHYNMTGHGKISDAVADFGDSGEYKVTNGDVIGQYVQTTGSSSFPDNNRLMEKEQVTKPNNGLDTVYYEITKKGFHPLKINQLQSKQASVNWHTSEEDLMKDLKEHASHYFENIKASEYKNIQPVGFDKFPDTKKVGLQSAKIRMEETLESGNTIQYAYDVQVMIEDTRPLTAEAVPFVTTLDIGTSRFSADKFVGNIKLDGKAVSKDEYTLVTIKHDDASRVGNFTFKVKITRKSNHVDTIIEVPIEVNYGNTLVLKGSNYLSVMGLSSHFYGSGNYTIEPSRVGAEKQDNFPINAKFSTQYFSVDMYHINNKINDIETSKPYYSFSKNGTDKLLEAYRTFKGQSYQPGDILKVNHVESLNYQQMVAMWSNGEKSEPQAGYVNQDAYYELTTTAFRPLHFNQLLPKEVATFLNTSHAALNKDFIKNMEKYLEVKNDKNNILPVGFIDYPDTSKPGKQQAKIRVEETLESGNKVQFDYAIQINVKNEWVNVTIPTKMLFLSDMKSKDKREIISENYSITNNSANTSLEVEMASFTVKGDTEVKFLSKGDKDPEKPEHSLRLNLLVDSVEKVNSLDAASLSTRLTDLKPKTSTILAFNGKYFSPESEDSPHVKSSMVLKFNIKE